MDKLKHCGSKYERKKKLKTLHVQDLMIFY